MGEMFSPMFEERKHIDDVLWPETHQNQDTALFSFPVSLCFMLYKTDDILNWYLALMFLIF